MRSLAAAALLACASAHACPDLVVEGAWIRAMPAGATMTAAYATLRNAGKQPLAIDGAVAPDFASAALHRTVVEDGMSRMRHGEPLRLAPGAKAALEPGGWHLMLMGPTRELQAGARVPLALQCGAESTEYTFIVRAPE
jgi:copper(I)-binding protein